ncbi:MAG: DUF815 domain-containing protein [Immundisolibacterales bacterium]|nr:DUF815 domain-containing protein [Immundisolibacterales bacterium]
MEPESLERFGLRLSFHPFSQDDCLAIVRHRVAALDDSGNGIGNRGAAQWETGRARALRWALDRGSRGGRRACRFARDRARRRWLDETD